VSWEEALRLTSKEGAKSLSSVADWKRMGRRSRAGDLGKRPKEETFVASGVNKKGHQLREPVASNGLPPVYGESSRSSCMSGTPFLRKLEGSKGRG